MFDQTPGYHSLAKLIHKINCYIILILQSCSPQCFQLQISLEWVMLVWFQTHKPYGRGVASREITQIIVFIPAHTIRKYIPPNRRTLPSTADENAVPLMHTWIQTSPIVFRVWWGMRFSFLSAVTLTKATTQQVCQISGPRLSKIKEKQWGLETFTSVLRPSQPLAANALSCRWWCWWSTVLTAIHSTGSASDCTQYFWGAWLDKCSAASYGISA